jgi:hypothetical protein
MVFEIDNLSGFAVKIRSEDVNAAFKLTLRRPAS